MELIFLNLLLLLGYNEPISHFLLWRDYEATNCERGYKVAWSGNGGNPALEPITAEALDLSYEWYFSQDGYLAVAGFYRDLNSWQAESQTVVDFSDVDIKSSIDSCNFSELQKQEEKVGFIESPKRNSNKFFFLGPKNDWQKILDIKISKKIETLFEKEMIELGYL
mgnify:CR=1 FL=1